MPPKRRGAASPSRNRKRAKVEEEDITFERSDTEFEPTDSDALAGDASSDSDESSYSEPRPKPAAAKKAARRVPSKGKKDASTKGATNTVVRRRNQVETPRPPFDVPLDIIYEILSRLTPLELLRLSRVNKSFRALLLNRAWKPLWDACGRNVKDYPPCPDDMAAPAFAELIFETWCHRCSNMKCKTEVYWVCRTRYCDVCAKHIWVNHKFCWDDIEYGFRHKEYPLVYVLPKLTSTFGQHDYSSSGYKRDQLVVTRIEDLIEFIQAWRAVAPADRERFLEDRKKKLKERHKHAEICFWWAQKRDEEEKQRKQSQKQDRYGEIVARLTEDGWGDVLQNLTNSQQQKFRALPDIKQKKPVTDRKHASSINFPADGMESGAAKVASHCCKQRVDAHIFLWRNASQSVHVMSSRQTNVSAFTERDEGVWRL
ncbi:hypothetical protein NM688_g1327 [Phlebia brevispora]|uniref:Uncharacterized protein n=1 Tax=Phlebia brevispora TaxID=194682 RepID=A0ACC1TC19_9APHY|nr:hypothetical protein NM688_g1327 [Phlebia brevispora]